MNVASNTFTYSPQDSIKTKDFINLNEGESTILVSTAGGSANQYQWYKDGNLLTSATNDTLLLTNVTLSDIGIYTCNITNTIVSGLAIIRRPVTVNVVSLTSINMKSVNDSKLKVYPNPSENGIYTVEITNNYGLIKVLDLCGKEILRFPVTNEKIELNLSILTKGIYFLRLETSNEESNLIKLIR
jgi:hypothetical protein